MFFLTPDEFIEYEMPLAIYCTIILGASYCQVLWVTKRRLNSGAKMYKNVYKIESEDQKGAHSHPSSIVESNKKKDSPWLARYPPRKSHGPFVYQSPLNFLSPPHACYETVLLPLLWLNIVAHPESQFYADSQ